MFILENFLFYFFSFLFLGAAIAFIYLIINPLQIRWAIIQARRIAAKNRVDNIPQFRNAYHTLTTARYDREAAKLWKQLDEMI